MKQKRLTSNFPTIFLSSNIILFVRLAAAGLSQRNETLFGDFVRACSFVLWYYLNGNEQLTH